MFKYAIIAGLGNPGKDYEGTRHNIGFNVLDRLSENRSWKSEDGYSRSDIEDGNCKAQLLKPMTFMNRSGEPLQSFMRYYRLEVAQLVVVYDDIDLEFGKIRIRDSGSAGGHNGIRSIISCLGTSDFVRVRMGVGRPATVDGQSSKRGVADWVLDRFSKEENRELPRFIDRGCDAVRTLLLEGLIVAQQRFSN